MSIRIKKIVFIIVHLLLWAVVGWCFCVFSHLRPLALHYWKELLSVAFVAAMVYTCYFVLIPKILFKRKRLLFWGSVFLLLVCTVLAEMFLVDSDIHVRAVWLSPSQFRLYYENTLFLLLLRDATFFFFFLLLKLYRTHAIALENIGKMISKETHKIIILSANKKPQLLDLKDIALFSYCDNNIVIVLKSGEQLRQNGSLSEIEALLPADCWIRANRQTIVMLDCIAYFTPKAIYVPMNGYEVIVKYFSTRSEKVLRDLKNWDSNKYKQEDFISMDSDRNEQDLPDHMQRTIDYLQENPNASTREVADALHISMRTAQRQLSQLRRMNNVE